MNRLTFGYARWALSYFDKTWMVAQSEKGALKGITLLHPRIVQDMSLGPVMETFEDSFAAIITLKVFP